MACLKFAKPSHLLEIGPRTPSKIVESTFEKLSCWFRKHCLVMFVHLFVGNHSSFPYKYKPPCLQNKQSRAWLLVSNSSQDKKHKCLSLNKNHHHQQQHQQQLIQVPEHKPDWLSCLKSQKAPHSFPQGPHNRSLTMSPQSEVKLLAFWSFL